MASKAYDMLKEREDRRTKLQSQLTALDAEIKVLREVLGNYSAVNGKKKRDRALNPKWVEILRFIADKGDTALADINDHAKSKNLETTDENIRSQMAIYVNSGLLERVNAGVFRITDHGKEKIGYEN